MTFSEAVEKMKEGLKVARSGSSASYAMVNNELFCLTYDSDGKLVNSRIYHIMVHPVLADDWGVVE